MYACKSVASSYKGWVGQKLEKSVCILYAWCGTVDLGAMHEVRKMGRRGGHQMPRCLKSVRGEILRSHR